MTCAVPIQGRDAEFDVVGEAGVYIPQIMETVRLQRAAQEISLGLRINYSHLASGALAIPVKNPILISLDCLNPYTSSSAPELLTDDTGRKGGVVLSLDLTKLTSDEEIGAVNTNLWLGMLALTQKLGEQNPSFINRVRNLWGKQIDYLSRGQNIARAVLLAEESPVLENL